MRPEETRAAPIRRRRWLRAGGGVAAFALWAAVAASGALAEEYRLQAGDVVEMSVAGLPEMSMRAAVQIDGSLNFPLVGPLEAAGMTVTETRDRIQTALASRLLPVYLGDGSETVRAVDRDQISASVVEYRPIFVSGDVARPGEQPFRAGMTARQAIAAAGGMNPAALLAPSHDPIQLRADYEGAWHAAISSSARVWSLRRELGENIEFDAAGLPPAPGSGSSIAETLRVETELRDARVRNHERERTFLKRRLEQIDGQADVLQRQLDVETQSEKVDADNLDAALAIDSEVLYTQSRQTRMADMSRISDIRNAALISSTRRLQTEASLMQLKLRRSEVARELERLDEDRHLGLLADLREARIAEERERARLRAADEKLWAAGLALPSDDQEPATVSIIRGSGAAKPANWDSEIWPGDSIEVVRGSGTAILSLGSSPNPRRQMTAAVQ